MRVLVLCTGNSCRSQMAEGYLRFYSNSHNQIYSAGIEAHGLNPNAVKCMLEDGIDISTHTSNTTEDYSNIHFDFVLTVCDNAKENCPVFSNSTKQVHCSFKDPAKFTGTESAIDKEFGNVRNEIKAYCKEFVVKYLS